ncbi:CrcB family protein [Macrococcoides caseolyticum]|uniref:fluoride efflux transporter FluC n=1 Tax=Macrococcoides caseolyticum TaxID=69966 RepID=UPI002D809C2D|nr:CrcB family protein [Macrococcus caseolyticus]MCE4957980.1 CrcB family protein [Macrococcus caseolyticus]
MVFVALGAPFGALLRFLISKLLNGHLPIGTLLINLSGAFLLGCAAHFSETYLLLFGTGFLGSFTTFSTFNVEVLQMMKRDWRTALVYFVVTYCFGPLLFFIAYTYHF